MFHFLLAFLIWNLGSWLEHILIFDYKIVFLWIQWNSSAYWSLDDHLFLVISLSLFFFVWICVGGGGRYGGGEPFKSLLCRSTWISNPKDGSTTLRATRQCLTTGPPSRSLWYVRSGVHLDEHQDRPNYPKSCFTEKGVRIKFQKV